MATTLLRPDFQQKRNELRLLPHCKFVNASEFKYLVISNRQLIRRDDAEARLRGLVDPTSGEVFVTEEEKLFS